jgi:hypothetical protein
MSSNKKKSKVFTGGRLTPIEGDTFRSKKSSQRSRSRKGNQTVFKSQDYSNMNFKSHLKNVIRPVDPSKTSDNFALPFGEEI